MSFAWGIRTLWIVTVLIVAAGRARAEQRYALVIGSNPGWSQDRPLRYAENDAERIRDVLVSLGGFTADRVALLRDPDAGEVRGALRKLDDTLRAGGPDDSLVFVYYSGHADALHLHLRGDPPLSHAELQDALRALPATIRLAVIDACKSGAVTRKGGSPTDEFAVDVVTPRLSGLVLLSSSGADELSQESRALAGSVFTHHLVSGLRGAADADRDQRVTLAEAYRHAYERTRADTATSGTQQRPAFRYELSGQGELVLTRLASGAQAQLRFPPGPGQKYVILDAHEWRLIGEVRSDPRRDTLLALAPGRYRVKRVLADRIEVASVDATAGLRSDLDRVSYRSVPLSSGIVKGEPDELSRHERHEWARAQAFGVLADGQATAALNLFDRLLRESPGDVVAWRGRGRALIRMADSFQRVNDVRGEQRALAEALRSDPSLSFDPDFQRRYQGFVKLDEAAKAELTARIARDVAERARPRSYKRLGFGVEVLSARGLFGLSGTYVVHERVMTSLAFDIPALAFDASVVFAPLRSRWSPYLALGGHVSLQRLGLDVGDPEIRIGEDPDLGRHLFGLHGRVEVGGQFVTVSGFTTELGIAVMGYGRDGAVKAQAFPVFHLGWLF